MTHFKLTSRIVAVLFAAVFIQSCSTNNNDAAEPDVGAAATNLVVSVQDLYWGTRDVGVQTTQYLTLSNQGNAAIRINSVAMAGLNAGEFSTSLDSAVTLDAGEAVEVAVSFAPQSEGRKYASLDIDYDLI